jgi:hypothetical protein
LTTGCAAAQGLANDAPRGAQTKRDQVAERIARARDTSASHIPLRGTFPVLNDTLITGEIPLLLTKLSLVPYAAEAERKPRG